MKKTIVILFLCAICAVANAQFIVNSPNPYLSEEVSDLDKLFLFNGIGSAEISYIGTDPDSEIKWLKFDGTEYASGKKPYRPKIIPATLSKLTYLLIGFG